MSRSRPEFSPAESFPEVIPDAVNQRRVRGDPSHSKSLPLFLSKRVLWIIFALAIIAIAVGLGAKFGIIGENSQTSLSVSLIIGCIPLNNHLDI